MRLYYVEIFPKNPEFYSMEQVNDNRFDTFNSGSGSNHFSTFCPSTKLRDETFMYAHNVEEAKMHKSPIRENMFWESPIRDNHVWESLIRKTQTPWKT